jgi:sugar phosphate isomerase/epimerase
MKTIKGPALFLAQFAGDEAPFNSWESITKWAADCGYKGVQVPSWDGRLIDLEKAAASKDYCDEFKGVARDNGVEVTELSTHLQGQLVAVHPAYDEAFDGFAAPQVRGNPKARQQWAVEQVKMALKPRSTWASMRWRASRARWPGPMSIPGRSGLRVWSRPPSTSLPSAGGRSSIMPRTAASTSATRSIPGEDLHDGVTFEMFLERVGNHARCNMLYDPSHYVLQCLDYLDNIDIYKDRIRMFHVKDAEFNPTGRQGVYSGYQSGSTGPAVPLARRRPGRFRRDLLEDGGQ